MFNTKKSSNSENNYDKKRTAAAVLLAFMKIFVYSLLTDIIFKFLGKGARGGEDILFKEGFPRKIFQKKIKVS